MGRVVINIATDTMGIPTDMIEPVLRSACPVKIGDRFYRETHCVKTGAVLKDYLKVIGIMPYKDGYAIRAKYENHATGPFERTFSSDIFQSDEWKIVRN